MIVVLIVSLFFVAILLGLITMYMGYIAVRSSPQYDLRRRLRKMAVTADERLPEDLQIEVLREMAPFDKFLYKFGFIKRLDKLIDNAGLKVEVKIFFLIILAAAAGGFTLGVAIDRGVIFSVLLMIFAAAVPFIYLYANKNRRLNRFTESFPNALEMIARSLRAGHSISAAIQTVGSEMGEPVAGLFKTAYDEQMLGLSLKDALARMLDRMQSMDLRLFVTAINIHREVGGNLAEVLERLAFTIRDRIRIRRQVKVYTAQGRLTGYILAALPIAMALFLYVTSPDYLAELWNEKVGRYAIAVVAAGQVIGFFIIKKLINIRI